jgi:glycerate kinase
MPKKISTEKSKWEAIKKELPKNWCQIVATALNKKGYKINSQSVSDARSGRIKNLLIQQAVWKEIKKVYKKQKRNQEAIAEIIHSQI